MNASNTCILYGNLGKAPEARAITLGNGQQMTIATFSLAVRRKYKRANEEDYKTDWFRVEVKGREAEWVMQNLYQGAKVLVCGSVEIDEWQDRENNKRTTVQISDASVQLVGERQQQQQSQQGYQQPYQPQQPAPQPQYQQPYPQQAPPQPVTPQQPAQYPAQPQGATYQNAQGQWQAPSYAPPPGISDPFANQ
jgi:single-strand DNA-binding protein